MNSISRNTLVLFLFGVMITLFAFGLGFIGGAAFDRAFLFLSLIGLFLSCDPSLLRRIFLAVGSLSLVSGWALAVVSIYNISIYEAIAWGGISIATFVAGATFDRWTGRCPNGQCP